MLLINLLAVGILHLTDDLDTVRVKIFKKACKLQGDPVNSGLIDIDSFYIDVRKKILQFHFFNKIRQLNLIHGCPLPVCLTINIGAACASIYRYLSLQALSVPSIKNTSAFLAPTLSNYSIA